MPKVFKVLDKIRPIYDWTYKIVMFVCKILLIIDILVTSMAVAGRYIPFIPAPAWSEQIVLTCMAYMAVLSATLAIYKNAHIRMTALDSYLPKKLIMWLDLLSDVAVMALGIILLVYGMEACSRIRGNYESLTWLSRKWMYYPIPLAGGSMIIFQLDQIVQHLKPFFVKEVQ